MARSKRQRRGSGRLSRSGDFERAYREGASHSNRFVVMHAFPRPDARDEGVRLGISVGKGLGGAVERNKVKRALREAFRDVDGRLPDGHDFVLVARPDLAGLVAREGTEGVRTCLEDVIRESGLARRNV
jgi:ribonuclease P protein component